jgi:hypothetical protein
LGNQDNKGFPTLPVTQGIKTEHGEAEKPLLQKKIIYNNLFEIEDAL